jgi:adenylate kinase family enzyme
MVALTLMNSYRIFCHISKFYIQRSRLSTGKHSSIQISQRMDADKIIQKNNVLNNVKYNIKSISN